MARQINFTDALRLAGRMTVARMLEHDTFQERYKAGEPIYIHEFMYPLMQGWDSVMVHSDVELGGTDQTFNNLIGRDFQIAEGQLPQIVMIMPILVGTDGVQKMGKSLGNYIGVSEPADEQFGKTMSIPDSLMPAWFRLCTPFPRRSHCLPRRRDSDASAEAKEVLGRTIVEEYHGAPAAETAAEEFRRRFTQGQLPSDIPAKTISASLLNPDGKIGLLTLIKEVGFS